MELIDHDIFLAHINLHPDKSLRQLSSCRLANNRIRVYDSSVVAMCVVHPTLLMLALFVRLRIRSRSSKFETYWRHEMKHCSNHTVSKNVERTTNLYLAEEMALIVCVFQATAFLQLVIYQCLLMSGDVEVNPGPLPQALDEGLVSY